MSTLTRDSIVTLREVHKENAREIIKLQVAEEQNKFVAPNDISIAQAYFEREKAWFRAIYADETPVGFMMLYDDPRTPVYFLWRLMMAAQYQGMGYGRQAIALLVEYVKTRPAATELKVSYVPAEGSPGPFYARLGFVDMGEMEGDEIVLSMKLNYAEGKGPKRPGDGR